MNADRTVGERPVADVFARVITNPAMDRWHRVVRYEFAPCGLVVTGLSQRQPGLDVLASRASVVAGWEEIDVVRALRTQRPCTSAVARQVRALCQVMSSHNLMPIIGMGYRRYIRGITNVVAARGRFTYRARPIRSLEFYNENRY